MSTISLFSIRRDEALHAMTETVLRAAGELDLESRHRCRDACLTVGGRDIRVDLRATTFMDCAGYSGLTAARDVVERRGGTMRWTGAIGQPARLLALIRTIDDPSDN